MRKMKSKGITVWNRCLLYPTKWLLRSLPPMFLIGINYLVWWARNLRVELHKKKHRKMGRITYKNQNSTISVKNTKILQDYGKIPEFTRNVWILQKLATMSNLLILTLLLFWLIFFKLLLALMVTQKLSVHNKNINNWFQQMF